MDSYQEQCLSQIADKKHNSLLSLKHTWNDGQNIYVIKMYKVQAS